MLLAGGCNTSPQTYPGFFNGTSLEGWSASDTSYWSVKDDAIVGHSTHEVKRNEFLWSNTEVTDFYLSVDVKLEPDSGNTGIQFRSKKFDERGQSVGYQADVGETGTRNTGRGSSWLKMRTKSKLKRPPAEILVSAKSR